MKKIITNKKALELDGAEIINFGNLYRIQTSSYKVNGKEIATAITVDGYRIKNNNLKNLEWDEEISSTVYIGEDVSDYREYEWAQYI